MSSIDTRAPFFPNSKSAQREIEQARKSSMLRRNSYERAQELQDKTGSHAKVSIPDTIRDFSRIKKVADTTPEVDNTAKIASLKAQIQAGTYQPDYDAIADKILATEY
ncbi:MAG: flagellar biosynthesis anti-sigma factor FlgM [Halobacteriovoraceae bacterium]|nr:flagellar biosynthesis anti-sigma factor FlgM [Halobacteriovoraceae bacterium]|tara:strand:+ start:10306 stop:10629 length:324 start_codon:yes stop_codon:yes gene_type:complete